MKTVETGKFMMTTNRNIHFPKDLSDWHDWLIRNSDSESEIWLVYYKKSSRKQGVAYEESVEEALCFGWVDSLIKNMDEQTCCRKFTPRKPGSSWSQVNIARAQKMIDQGRMTDKGRILFEESRINQAPNREERKAMLERFRAALVERMQTADRDLYHALSPSTQRQYAGWVMSAAKEETRGKRLNEVLDALRKGVRLGLK